MEEIKMSAYMNIVPCVLHLSSLTELPVLNRLPLCLWLHGGATVKGNRPFTESRSASWGQPSLIQLRWGSEGLSLAHQDCSLQDLQQLFLPLSSSPSSHEEATGGCHGNWLILPQEACQL